MRTRYYHDDLGFNFRMTDVHAAIGHEQLKKLPKFNEARQRNAKFLSEHLQGVTVPYVPSECEHVYHQYTIRVGGGKRDAMIEHLKKHEIGCGVYYPVPVHKQNYYTKNLGYDQSLPETEKAALEVLSLPVHPGLSPADLESIVSAVNEFAG
jgi:dTDP-4-amino-4,6-dideoxygalactose transaminase